MKSVTRHVFYITSASHFHDHKGSVYVTPRFMMCSVNPYGYCV